MTTKLSNRLRELMLLKGNWSEIDLVRASTLPQPTIHHILSGATSRPHRKSLESLANALDVSIIELFEENPLPEQLGINNQLHRVPLLTWEQAAHWPNGIKQESINANASKIYTDANVSDNGFALTIQQSNLEAMFPSGAIIIIDPNLEPHDQNYVVVQLGGEPDVLLRQILVDGSSQYLKTINPELSDVKPTTLGENDRVIGIVIQTKINIA